MDTPRGLEVLLKKASVDAEFRVLLLENRSGACTAIGLELDPAESTMLDAMPAEQLDAIIQRTRVRPEDRRVFLGKAASVMLAALVAGVSGCKDKSTDTSPKSPSPDQPPAQRATARSRCRQPWAVSAGLAPVAGHAHGARHRNRLDLLTAEGIGCGNERFIDADATRPDWPDNRRRPSLGGWGRPAWHSPWA